MIIPSKAGWPVPYCPDSTARRHVEGAVYSGGSVKDTPTALAGEKANDYGEVFWKLRPGQPVPVATQLERLPSGIVYLGSPYSKQADREDAAIDAGIAAAWLMERGHVVYAPIPHGHAVAAHGLPTHWDFWRRQCDPFIEAASSLVVLKIDGWRDSVGLTYEIARFHEAGKPIVYVTMGGVGVMSDKIPADIWRAAKEIVESVEYDDWDDDSANAIAEAIAAERKRCAGVARGIRNTADVYGNPDMMRAANMIAHRIESGE